MGIWKRAQLYLARKKMRTALLFVILFAAGTGLLVANSLRLAAGKAAEKMRGTFLTGWEIELAVLPADVLETYTDENGATVRKAKTALLTNDRLAEVMAIDGVIGHYAPGGENILYTGLKVEPGIFSTPLPQEEIAGMSEEEYEEHLASADSYTHANNFCGVEDAQWHPFFLNGSMALTEGRYIRADDRKKAMISDRLAKQNGLSLGDTISARNFKFITGELYGATYDVEIVGIFHVNFDQKISNYTPEYEILENYIFTQREMTDWSVNESRAYDGDPPLIYGENALGGIFYVEDPLLLDRVKEQFLEMENVDWSVYEFIRHEDEYLAAAKPLLTIEKLFTVLFVILAAGALVILYLILSLWIRGRKHEMGVLLSVGISKRAVLLQFLLECTLITAAALLLAGALAHPAAEAAGGVVESVFGPSETDETYQTKYDRYNQIVVQKNASDPIDLGNTVTVRMWIFVFLSIWAVVLLAAVFSSAQIMERKPKELCGK